MPVNLRADWRGQLSSVCALCAEIFPKCKVWWCMLLAISHKALLIHCHLWGAVGFVADQCLSLSIWTQLAKLSWWTADPAGSSMPTVVVPASLQENKGGLDWDSHRSSRWTWVRNFAFSYAVTLGLCCRRRIKSSGFPWAQECLWKWCYGPIRVSLFEGNLFPPHSHWFTSGPASPTVPLTPGGPTGPSGPGLPSLPEGPTGPGGP